MLHALARHYQADPQHPPFARLLVTGEKADKVGSYAVGAQGALTRTGEAPSGKGALWIEMLNLPGV